MTTVMASRSDGDAPVKLRHCGDWLDGYAFLAQIVDGALGMAFGVISSTMMVSVLGLPPALASQRVHIVECFTTATSGT